MGNLTTNISLMHSKKKKQPWAAHKPLSHPHIHTTHIYMHTKSMDITNTLFQLYFSGLHTIHKMGVDFLTIFLFPPSFGEINRSCHVQHSCGISLLLKADKTSAHSPDDGQVLLYRLMLEMVRPRVMKAEGW